MQINHLLPSGPRLVDNLLVCLPLQPCLKESRPRQNDLNLRPSFSGFSRYNAFASRAMQSFRCLFQGGSLDPTAFRSLRSDARSCFELDGARFLRQQDSIRRTGGFGRALASANAKSCAGANGTTTPGDHNRGANACQFQVSGEAEHHVALDSNSPSVFFYGRWPARR